GGTQEARDMVVEAEEIALPHRRRVVHGVAAREAEIEHRHPKLVGANVLAVHESDAVDHGPFSSSISRADMVTGRWSSAPGGRCLPASFFAPQGFFAAARLFTEARGGAAAMRVSAAVS